MSNLFTRIWLFIKKWLARFGIAIIFFCLLLPIFGIPVNEMFLIGIITVILLGIYEIAFDTKNAEIPKLKAQVAETCKAVEYFSHRATPKLISLYVCKVELEEMLKTAPRNETIFIDHLGLDMSQAWEYIHNLLFDKDSQAVGVEYRLLILTDDKTKSSTWPKEVVGWSDVVPNSLDRIHSEMEVSLQLFIKERRRLKFSVRKYNEVPVVHGWSLRRPIKVWHVAHCRWREEFFDWSPESYVKVDELSKDPVTLDVAKLFDSYFEHLWMVSSPIPNLQFDFDPNQS